MALNSNANDADSLIVKPLELKDVEQMHNWGLHDDIRFQAYNFPYNRPMEYLMWYQSKKRPFKRYIFGVFLGEILIGYITLKQIKWLQKEAFMGVAFDPNYMNKGYGTAAIKAYLEIVSKKYGMKRIRLKTAIFNVRGQKCYQKAGFKVYERCFEPFEDQSQNFDLLLNHGDFQMVGDEIWTDYLYMVNEIN